MMKNKAIIMVANVMANEALRKISLASGTLARVLS